MGWRNGGRKVSRRAIISLGSDMRDQQKVERSNREEMIEMEGEMREAQPIDGCVMFLAARNECW